MNQDDKEWAKGWRAVLTCNDCQEKIWSKKVGQLVECKCDIPNYVRDSPYHFEHGRHRDNYDLVLQKVEQAY